MRILTTLLAIFSCCTLAAQPYTTTENREPARSAIMPYATEAEAAAHPEKHRYGAVVSEWSCVGERLTASFTVPFAWNNRQVMLRIASASADYELWINGRRAAYTADGNTAADFNITKLVKEGRNTAEVRLQSPSLLIPIEGWKGAQTPAIGRVELFSSPTMGVRDVFVRTVMNSENAALASTEVGIVIKTYTLNPRSTRLYYELNDPAGRNLARGQSDLTLQMRGEDTVRFVATVPDTLLWESGRPTHCTLLLKTQREGRYMEYHNYPIALRSIDGISKEGALMINGKAISGTLRRVEPTATPEELQQLKKEGVSAIRLGVGAVPDALYTACDTLGLYVIAQAPIDSHKGGSSRAVGGNPSNNPAWKPYYIERAENTLHTTKRHPSVVAYSIAEESANGICLYEAYLHMKTLEPQRPILYPAAGGEWNDDGLKVE